MKWPFSSHSVIGGTGFGQKFRFNVVEGKKLLRERGILNTITVHWVPLLRPWGMCKCDGSQLRRLWLWRVVSTNLAADVHPLVSHCLKKSRRLKIKRRRQHQRRLAPHLLPFSRTGKNVPRLRLRNMKGKTAGAACACVYVSWLNVSESISVYLFLYLVVNVELFLPRAAFSA